MTSATVTLRRRWTDFRRRCKAGCGCWYCGMGDALANCRRLCIFCLERRLLPVRLRILGLLYLGLDWLDFRKK